MRGLPNTQMKKGLHKLIVFLLDNANNINEINLVISGGVCSISH